MHANRTVAALLMVRSLNRTPRRDVFFQRCVPPPNVIFILYEN
jgi:hypothetical protein